MPVVTSFQHFERLCVSTSRFMRMRSMYVHTSACAFLTAPASVAFCAFTLAPCAGALFAFALAFAVVVFFVSFFIAFLPVFSPSAAVFELLNFVNISGTLAALFLFDGAKVLLLRGRLFHNI